MKPQVANIPYAGRICYTHADCGFAEDTAAGQEGFFKDGKANQRPSPTAFYHPYFAAIPSGQKFSRFLIDGRVRSQLAVLCLMHMADPSDSVVFIHDWVDPSRDYYQKWTLKIYDIISVQKRIVALRPKLNAIQLLQQLLQSSGRPPFWR
jgi:hypothetical protein